MGKIAKCEIEILPKLKFGQLWKFVWVCKKVAIFEVLEGI